MLILDKTSILTCGHGKLAHVNLQSGMYSRFLTASETAKYSCLCKLNGSTFCVGTEEGKISALDFSSNIELGSVDLEFPLKGFVALPGRLLAFGGSWNNSKRSAAFVLWEDLNIPTSISAAARE
jgi:hypothetical protein